MNQSKNYVPTSRSWANYSRVTFLFFLLVATSLVMSGQNTQQSAVVGPRVKTAEWFHYEVKGIPYEIAFEWLSGKEEGWGSKRVLFLYLESKYFNKENLLLVFGNVSSKVPQPTFLNATLLSDREAVRRRVQAYHGLVTSADDIHSRLTGNFDGCCPKDFTGAQFDRYRDEARFFICAQGRGQEINAQIKSEQAEKRKQ